MAFPDVSILSRRTAFADPTARSPLASQVDGLVSQFIEEAANPQALAALTAGGMAYRVGKIGVMSSFIGATGGVPARLASILMGLGLEVTAFEFTSRGFQSFRATGQSPLQDPSPVTDHPSPNLWSWNGPGGWRQALINDALTFGLLKGAGHLSRESNLIFQHAFSSTAMVAGHKAAHLLDLSPRPEGTLAVQLLHAEAVNLQLGAGASLVRSLSPSLFAWERGLDLSIPSRSPRLSLQPSSPLWAIETPLTPLGFSSETPKNPHLLMMAEYPPDHPPPPPSLNRRETPLELNTSERRRLVETMRNHLEKNIRPEHSQVAVRSLNAEDFRQMEQLSSEAFEIFLKANFTPAEQERLQRFSRTEEGRPPKFYSRVASILATKKAVLRLLNLDHPSHWAEIQFRFGRPDLFGEARNRLGNRALLVSASDDGNIGVGVAILESAEGASGLAGLGIDLTTDRVRYTTPAAHARGEAAYKATFRAHPVRQFNAKTGAEIRQDASGNFILIGKTAKAARDLRGELESNEPLPVDVLDFQVGRAIGALVTVPTLSPPRIIISSPVENEPWPKEIILNGTYVTRDFKRLDLALSSQAGYRIDSRRAISLLIPRLPDYLLGSLAFREHPNGTFEIEGSILFKGWREVAGFSRFLIRNIEGPRFYLVAKGNGLEISPPEFRGNGLGTQMVLNDLRFFRALGVSTLFVPVGREGGAFWSERGFDFGSSKIRQRKIFQFENYLDHQKIRLSTQDQERLDRIEHSWELTRFTTESGQAVGKEYMKLYLVENWDSRFDLDSSSPGWSVFRRTWEDKNYQYPPLPELGIP